MTEPVEKASGDDLRGLLSQLNQHSGALTSDELLRLQEFVQQVGGLEAAQALFETLDEVASEGLALEDLEELLDDDDLQDGVADEADDASVDPDDTDVDQLAA
jgi:hypothetical protein